MIGRQELFFINSLEIAGALEQVNLPSFDLHRWSKIKHAKTSVITVLHVRYTVYKLATCIKDIVITRICFCFY